MDEATLVLIFVLAFNGIFDAVVVAWLAGKRSRNALLYALANPDDQVKEAVEVLSGLLVENMWDSMNTPSIEVDAKDPEGKPTKIKISAIQAVVSTAVTEAGNVIPDLIFNKIRGLKGAVDKASMKIEDQMAVQFGLPKKGQTMVDYAMEQMQVKILEQIQPVVSNAVQNALNKLPANSQQASTVKGWD